MDPEEAARAAPGWPPPHPSPPLPPPREYGAPGTAPDWRWLWASLVVVVVGVLVAVVLVVTAGGRDDTADPAVRQPGQTPGTGRASPTESATPAPYRCWDGVAAQALRDCSRPSGEAGLRWVFPHLADERCSKPTTSRQGVVLRILCSARLSDGSRILLGYYEWVSVRVGADFYDGQRLVRSEGGGLHHWVGGTADTRKAAQLYVGAPFSLTVTLPADAVASPADLDRLQPRAPAQLRGEPVG